MIEGYPHASGKFRKYRKSADERTNVMAPLQKLHTELGENRAFLNWRAPPCSVVQVYPVYPNR